MIWPHFKKDNPCPACGHWDWACRAGDRAFVCMRVASDRPAKDGGFYHFYDGEKPLKLPPKRFSPPKRTTVPEIKIKTCGEDLARDLGVSMSALRTLGVGWSDAYGAWMFPMKNGRGEIVGWNRRYKTGEKKIVAGIFGILLGSFGIHKFYLGYTKEGIIQLVVSVLTCGIGGIIGFIEGIIYLTKSDEDFVATYITGKKGCF